MGRQIAGHTILRVAYIVELLTQGHTTGEIIEIIKDKYNLKGRRAQELVSMAKGDISSRADEGKEYHLTVAKDRLNNWARKSAENGDLRTAGILQRELNEITGLHQTGGNTTINVTNYYPAADTIQNLTLINTGVTPNET